MSSRIHRPVMEEIGEGYRKRKLWSNVKLGEITDERLARILKATQSNCVCYSFEPTIRDGKMVMEIYGDDVPDDFKQMLELAQK